MSVQSVRAAESGPQLAAAATEQAQALAYELDQLDLDVFEINDGQPVIESLTGAHGMTEFGASCCCDWFGSCCCCGG